MKNFTFRTHAAAVMVAVTAVTSSMAQDEAAALKAIREATGS